MMKPTGKNPDCAYVLITPARNEEAFIEKTIASVVSQTVLPARWVIVSDGSTDRTSEIISGICRNNVIYTGIRLSHNCGQQNALLAGLMQAREYDDIAV